MALYLLKENPSEFLRRFAIICIEDAVLHSAFSALVSVAAAFQSRCVEGNNPILRLRSILQPCRICCSQAAGSVQIHMRGLQLNPMGKLCGKMPKTPLSRYSTAVSHNR